MAITLPDIEQATKQLRPFLNVTPLLRSAAFSERLGREIFIKWDNMHRTGSFKERGALHALMSLTDAQRKNGVCAASAGNHAMALSFHAQRLKVPCTVVMPVTAPLVKVQSAQNYGAEVILFGHTLDEAYQHCLGLATERNFEFISAYDDERVVTGQGSCGIEIVDQLADFDSIVVPIGGGGLIGGIATVLKAKRPDIFILGVQSEWAVSARRSAPSTVSSGKKVVSPASLTMLSRLPPATVADGIAVKRIGKVTGPLIEKLVDKVVSVSESVIAHAIVQYIEHEHAVVEGAGAASLAGVLANHLPPKCRRTVLLACGSNIDINVLSRLLERDMGERGRLLRMQLSVPDRPGSLAFATAIFAREAANILEVIHDRSFSRIPGNVDITFELEVRNEDHKTRILEALREAHIETVTREDSRMIAPTKNAPSPEQSVSTRKAKQLAQRNKNKK